MNYLQKEIVETEKAIAKALQEIRIYYAKLEKLREIDAEFLSEGDGKWFEQRYDNPRSRMPLYRTARPRWQSIMQMVHYLEKEEFTYSDLSNAIKVHSFKIADSSMRAQMYKYIKKGYVQRMGEGAFKLTGAGLVHFGIYYQ